MADYGMPLDKRPENLISRTSERNDDRTTAQAGANDKAQDYANDSHGPFSPSIVAST
jgi:hypothetical protein